MAYKMFAAIYVGSNEIAMKISEVTSGKKNFKVVDSVSRILELGKDTYNTGYVSTEAINAACDILNDFRNKMKEYQVTDYRVYTSSAIREAKNAEIVLDSIKRKTGFEVAVLSNSEQRYMSYKGLVAKYDDFHDVVTKNTAFVDVGSGSVQISLFDKNHLSLTENIHIGAVRVRDYLSMMGNRSGQLDRIISEYVDSDIVSFRNIYLNDKEIKNVIAVGEFANAVRRVIPEYVKNEKVTREEFNILYQRVVELTPEQISEKYGLPYERATLMLPNVIIYQSFMDNSKAEEIYVPKVDFCEGITASYISEGSGVVFNHNFYEDIIAAANSISRRYRSNKAHVERVCDYALQIFDSVKKLHGMGKQERLQLQIAAILHECGNFINLSNGAENSYYIVANSEILGLSHKERMEVANVVRYNVMYLPPKKDLGDSLGECDYIKIAKLAAILRIANILDKSHTQKLSDLNISMKDDKMIITAKTYDDMSLEAGLFEGRADFFEKVYGIRPVLKVKRSV
jgi:exopolyphosphatase/guanosine-5'-triphosphate,3'-diphosphate pyrophosphatase